MRRLFASRFLLPTTALLLLFSAAGAFAGQVNGKVVFDDDPPPPKEINMDADPVCASKHDGPVYSERLVLGADKSMANVFVQVKNPPAGDYPAPAEPVVIDQIGCLYVPHVVGAMVGQPVLFKNSDGILHNVHGSPEANPPFNDAMLAMIKEKRKVFNLPEPAFPVMCNVHPWMTSYVAVMTHPFFDVTGEDGSFTLENLPDGEYEIEAWHEMLGTKTAKVMVSGGAASVDFSYTRADRK